MSEIKVDKVSPQSGTELEIGDSGDTVTVPSGATLDISDATLTPPATMPASSGANLTSLPAGNLTGTIADARFPATLPAASGANLTALTAGNITGIVPTANLGTGTANADTFLNGSGAYSAAGGGAFTLISSATASNTTYMDMAIDTTQYNTYLIRVENLVAASSGSYPYMRFGDSGGIDSGANYYWVQARQDTSAGSFTTAYGTNSSKARIDDANVSNDTKETFSGNIWLNAPSAAQAAQPNLHFEVALSNASNHLQHIIGSCGRNPGTAFTMTQFRFYMNSGNMTSGRFSLYGLSQS